MYIEYVSSRNEINYYRKKGEEAEILKLMIQSRRIVNYESTNIKRAFHFVLITDVTNLHKVARTTRNCNELSHKPQRICRKIYFTTLDSRVCSMMGYF